jgi:hypothetical protein
LQIEISRDGTVVKQLVLTVLDAALAECEAFGFEPVLL